MPRRGVYHLDLDDEKIQEARFALLPGDPFRSALIAERIAAFHGGRLADRPLAHKREYCTYLTEICGAKVSVTSTGIGGPSASIAIGAVETLAPSLECRYHVGITASTFYQGQERDAAFPRSVPRHVQGMTEEWRQLHVLNYEMESSTLLTVCSAFGLRGGCVTGVINTRSTDARGGVIARWSS